MNRFVTTCALSVALGGCNEKPKQQQAENGPTESQAALEALENPSAPAPDQPLAAGDTVFDFSALAHTGQSLQLSEFLARPVLVYFCPTDRSPPCLQLALALREHWLVLNPSLSMVFGVSSDDTFVHRDFASEHALPHLLLADGDGSVHRLFGLRPGVTTAYLIGTDRKILRVLQPDPAGFADQVRRALAELNLERPIPPI